MPPRLAAGDLSFRAGRKVLRRLSPLSPFPPPSSPAPPLVPCASATLEIADRGKRTRQTGRRFPFPAARPPFLPSDRMSCRTLPIHSYCTNEPFLPPYARRASSRIQMHARGNRDRSYVFATNWPSPVANTACILFFDIFEKSMYMIIDLSVETTRFEVNVSRSASTYIDILRSIRLLYIVYLRKMMIFKM